MKVEDSQKPYDLEDRLVAFAGDCILFCRKADKSIEGLYLKDQLIRASSSAALNYGEAQGTQTKADFIHKLSLVLKELKEVRVALKISLYVNLGETVEVKNILDEANELISIGSRMILNKKNTK